MSPAPQQWLAAIKSQHPDANVYGIRIEQYRPKTSEFPATTEAGWFPDTGAIIALPTMLNDHSAIAALEAWHQVMVGLDDVKTTFRCVLPPFVV